MPRNTTVPVAVGSWVEITSADITVATFANVRGDDEVWVIAGSSTPSGDPAEIGAIPLQPKTGMVDATLADVWPGIASPLRLYAYCPDGPADVMISHA